ncbi:Ribonuclease H-like superfamily [Sesbania bispinosa]|nr:Ribonuclease H-like superfamily [Sesbania bispinosa]
MKMRDSSGRILVVSSKVVSTSSPLIVEALAVREGVLLVSATPWPKILIESDNQSVIEETRGGNQQWAINQIVRDTITLSRYIPFCGFIWTRREGNNLAHTLAQMTMELGTQIQSVNDIPPSLREIVVLDARRATTSSGEDLQDLVDTNEP